VKATVASSSVSWPAAVVELALRLTRLLMFRMPLSPQGDQMTAVEGTSSSLVYSLPAAHWAPEMVVRVVVWFLISAKS
jgi:hypothetical protein